MSKIFSDMLLAVITVCVPILSTYVIKFLEELKEKNIAQTDNIILRSYLEEISDAVQMSVATTSQTYVDTLKKSGAFTKENQLKAAQKALMICLSAISPKVTQFIERVYGDTKQYLIDRIEAEVRKQKTQ